MTFVDRYIFVRESLRSLIRERNPDRVGIESPPFGETFSEGMYGLFLYSNEALKLEKRDVVYFTPGQVKAHARETLGRPKGWKMMKPDMVDAAKLDTRTVTPEITKKTYKIRNVWDHNEADAYLVARVAGRFWNFYSGLLAEDSLTRTESSMFSEIHTYVRGKNAGKTVHKGLLFREEDRFFRWSTL
jgi:hypothetical protein